MPWSSWALAWTGVGPEAFGVDRLALCADVDVNVAVLYDLFGGRRWGLLCRLGLG